MGEQKFPYWFEVIEEARALGEFTNAQRARAGDWTTCACGEQDPRIPRYEQDDEDETGARVDAGAPKDDVLSALGCRFAWAVEDDDLDGALALLLEGETLSSVLCPLCDGSGWRGIVADQPPEPPATMPAEIFQPSEIFRSYAAFVELHREWSTLDLFERRRRLADLKYQLDSLIERLLP